MKRFWENLLAMFDREANIYNMSVVFSLAILIVWFAVFLVVYQTEVFFALVVVWFGYSVYVVGSGKDR